MKIGIQTLKNAKYQLEVKETDTILEVKQAINREFQLGEPDEQKLVHLGKILKDDQTVESIKIKPNDMIVVMVTKKRSFKPAAATTMTPSESSSSSSSASASPPSATTATTATAAPTSATTGATVTVPRPIPATAVSAPAAAGAPASVAAGGFAMGPEREEAIMNLMSLGFERDQVIRALRAAFFDANRAAEYLFSGIPASALGASEAPVRPQPAAAASGGAQQSAAAPTAEAAAGAGAAAAAAAAAATGNALPAGLPAGLEGVDFSQLRTLIQSNPQLLPILFSQLAQTHPELVQQLENQPQALMQLMGALGAIPAGGAGGDAGMMGGVPEGSQVIQITPEEKSQIDQLESFGFSRQAALEAWLLCDRNAEMAATYLLEHGHELEHDDQNDAFMAPEDHGHGGDGDDDEDGDINPDDYVE